MNAGPFYNIVLNYGDELMSFGTIAEANTFLAKNPDPDEAFAEDKDCKMQSEFDASSGVLVQF